MKKLAILTIASSLIFIMTGCAGMGNAPPPADPPPPPYYDPAPPPPPAPDPTYDDTSLHGRVHDALRRAPSIDESRISVRVEGSTVYLSGYVSNQNQKETAHNVVHAVEGVSRVYYDEIRVD